MLFEDPRPAESPEEAMPLEVEILTKDHEIKGLVFVSRGIDERRRLTDLLNDAERRFLAIKDVELKARSGPSSPRHYSFLQLQMDEIIMMHPTAESTARSIDMSGDEDRLNQLRGKMKQSGQPDATAE